MTEPTNRVTLSDGSVWQYYPLAPETTRWQQATVEGVRCGREPRLILGFEPLTASDHRAIADVLDPPKAEPELGAGDPPLRSPSELSVAINETLRLDRR